jgi:MATE family multidrug resistance protein
MARTLALSGGGREVLTFAYPLILGQMTFTVQTFVDRLLVTWYSPQAVAAVTASRMVMLAGLLICVGTGEYTTTFIAQYLGAGHPRRIGPVVWQGVWFSLSAGLLLATVAPAAGFVFEIAGHDPALRAMETAYAEIILRGAVPIILMPTLASFFAGRGQTRVALLGNVQVALVNGVLDYL